MTHDPLLSAAFAVLILGVMAVDLGLINRKAHEPSLRESSLWCLLWISLAFAFAAVVGFTHGREKALQFVAGYLLEQSLSVDNMFVFVLIFRYFAVSKKNQPRVLHWGILGAIVMRLIFIAAGVELLRRLHWMTFVFGGLLLFTAVKMLVQSDEEVDPAKNPALRLLKRFMPVLSSERGQAFLSLENGRWHATPLLAAVLVVEFSDLIFAIDSIPAVIAVTADPFIVYTSNIFAIMGLRSLYFLLAGLIDGLRYLKHGISAILAFVGLKMVVSPWLHISIGVSLGVIAGVLALAVGASLLSARRTKAAR